LNQRLRGARAYRRIAGYFRSSIFELVGEALDGIECIQIVCNSDLAPADWQVARRAREIALLERWNQPAPEVEALLHRERYRRLDALLRSGRVEVRVVPADRVFLHGKAGVIEYPDGAKTCFIGSVNETRSAFTSNYEIVWEDPSPEGVQWVEEEFAALWKEAHPLPDLILEQIRRIAEREEVAITDLTPTDTPGAALAEAPIYRSGEGLQPWQRAFAVTFLEHRQIYGKARLLLADEVGLGKTLSLGTAALLATLLGDGPVLILCPATLTLQWQTELADKLGIPSAVWHSSDKSWSDPHGHTIRTRGAEDVVHCPLQIGIISTGLIFRNSEERQCLLTRRYGTVILDEAHRARRRGGMEQRESARNNLLDFMLNIAPRTRHLLLGTATPIQTEVYELWDLLCILNTGAEFVLGKQISPWSDCKKALPVVKGEWAPADDREAWEWIRNPLPPKHEHEIFATLRLLLEVADDSFFVGSGPGSLDFATRYMLSAKLDSEFLREHNPVVRHTVLRKRRALEEQGLLERINVIVHPDPDAPGGTYGDVPFHNTGLHTSYSFNIAYEAAEKFTHALARRTHVAGFIKTLLLQRICSSFAAGKSTAEKLLHHQVPDEEEEAVEHREIFIDMSAEEAEQLQIIVAELSRQEARDPKLEAVIAFLTRQQSEGKTWLEHGCIIFSQYYDTARAVATYLAESLRDEPVAIYAGTGGSGMYYQSKYTLVEREEIKTAVRRREVRLVVATDAACEGLNLQALGTLINVDLPWNPSRLEQRLGRIKRFGQRRTSIDMLNLVYHNTLDERIYQALSRRMKDRYDIFGNLPDTIEDDWIENIERLEEMMDKYLHLRQQARNAFEMRYEEHVDPDRDRWEQCARVLARHDIVSMLSVPWDHSRK
ncbi:MAG: phospholipase D-like domain-containing anti-phage protein, partial [candidate division WOR-3 bacterium]